MVHAVVEWDGGGKANEFDFILVSRPDGGRGFADIGGEFAVGFGQ